MNKRVLKLVSNILFLLVFLFVLLCAGWAITTRFTQGESNIFGLRIFYIVTDSMEPDLMVGDFIVSRVITNEESAMSLNVGDVVTFIGTTGAQRGLLITHQIIEEPFYNGGRYYIVTRGTNPSATIDAPTPISNIRAVKQFRVPQGVAIGLLVTIILVILISIAIAIALKLLRKEQTISPPAKKDS